MDGLWFAPRLHIGSGPEDPFVDEVRELAAEALAGLVQPSATWSTDYADCLLVVDHPALAGAGARPSTTLQVNWSAGRLAGSWATDALWDDDDPADEDALLVQGIAITERAAAVAAVDWLVQQLSRPVDHEIRTLPGVHRLSDRMSQRLRTDRWVLADTGQTLVSRGAAARRGAVRSSCRVHPPVPDEVVERAWAEAARDCGCPDIYYCPSSRQVECSRHSGFDVCCPHPGVHHSVPAGLRVQHGRPWADPANLDGDV